MAWNGAVCTECGGNLAITLALYIHWPFCRHLCPYCDFNSHVRADIDASLWQESYRTAIHHYADIWRNAEITSLYFGGGTPSLMPPELVADIIAAFALDPATIEITLEANPTSVEAGKLRAFKEAGVNRVSLGVQALNPHDLTFLGRKHSVDEALNAVKLANDIFERTNFDLIYARPNQTVAQWEAELQQAIPLMRGHASLYQLTIEKGTPFYKSYQKQAFTLPDEETQRIMLERTYEMMKAHGMPYYEVSNFAEPGQESQHNLSYWRYQSYLGIGPGAHSRVRSPDGSTLAMMDIHRPEAWLKQVAQHGHGQQQCQNIPPQDMREEAIMMGLRLREGIDMHAFEAQFGISLQQCCNTDKWDIFCENGWLTEENNRLMTTQSGLAVLNAITTELLL